MGDLIFTEQLKSIQDYVEVIETLEKVGYKVISPENPKECEHGTPWRYILNCADCIGVFPDKDIMGPSSGTVT